MYDDFGSLVVKEDPDEVVRQETRRGQQTKNIITALRTVRMGVLEQARGLKMLETAVENTPIHTLAKALGSYDEEEKASTQLKWS